MRFNTKWRCPAAAWALGLALTGLCSCSSPTLEEMFEAAERGDVDTIESAIEGGIPVDARSAGGMTALRLAAVNGRAEAVALLLEAGADPAAEYTSPGPGTRLTSRVVVGVQASLSLIDNPEYGRPMKERGVTKEGLVQVLQMLEGH